MDTGSDAEMSRLSSMSDGVGLTGSGVAGTVVGGEESLVMSSDAGDVGDEGGDASSMSSSKGMGERGAVCSASDHARTSQTRD